MHTGERIRKYRKEQGITAEFIAEKLGCSPATIYRYENGSIDKIPEKILAPVAQILKTTPAYLSGWVADDDPLIGVGNLLPMPKTRPVPLLGAIACGEPLLAEENIEEYIDVPEDIRADFCLRCVGDSMIGARILDGDIVFIRKQPDVDDGDIAAVLIDGEATLKRVYKFQDRLELRAENPTFPRLSFEGEKLDEIKILGKAIAFLSSIS